MKAIYYINTVHGNKIVASICDPVTDPLETNKKVFDYLQGLPMYQDYKRLLDGYADYIKSPDYLETVNGKSVAIRRLDVIKQKMETLKGIEAEYRASNSVWLIPDNAILVSDEIGADVAASLAPGSLTVITLDESGAYSGFTVKPDNAGKVYRLPNSPDWITIESGDFDMPEGALFTAPDEAESAIIELNRVAALSPEDKQKEFDKVSAMMRQACANDISLAQLEETPEAIAGAIAAAKSLLNDRIAGLTAKYGL